MHSTANALRVVDVRGSGCFSCMEVVSGQRQLVMPDAPDTNEAIRRVLAGERDAFRLLVREHQLAIRSYLSSQLHHNDDTDDIAQEVFVRAYKSLAEFDQSGDFRAWLRGIARHQLLMHFRGSRRRRAHEQRFREQVEAAIETDIEAAHANMPDAAIESLLQCVSSLPDRMRRVVRAGLEGVKAAALAEELNTSVGAIYNLHYRANSLLRECVAREIN